MWKTSAVGHVNTSAFEHFLLPTDAHNFKKK